MKNVTYIICSYVYELSSYIISYIRLQWLISYRHQTENLTYISRVRHITLYSEKKLS